MTLNTFLPILILSLFVSTNNSIEPSRQVVFYRKDIGLYFKFDKEANSAKISVKKNWYFNFSLMNDSIALIQDVKNKLIQKPKKYKIIFTVDSSYQRKFDGKKYKSEKKYFPTLKLISNEAL